MSQCVPAAHAPCKCHYRQSATEELECLHGALRATPSTAVRHSAFLLPMHVDAEPVTKPRSLPLQQPPLLRPDAIPSRTQSISALPALFLSISRPC